MPKPISAYTIKILWENNADTPIMSSTLSRSIDFVSSYIGYNFIDAPASGGTIFKIDPDNSAQLIMKRGTIFSIINESENVSGDKIIPINDRYRVFDIGLEDLYVTVNDKDQNSSNPALNWGENKDWIIYLCDKDDNSSYNKMLPDQYGGGAQILVSLRRKDIDGNYIMYPTAKVPGRPLDNYSKWDTRIIGGFKSDRTGMIIADSVWDIAGKEREVKAKTYSIIDELSVDYDDTNIDQYKRFLYRPLRPGDLDTTSTDHNNVFGNNVTINGNLVIGGTDPRNGPNKDALYNNLSILGEINFRDYMWIETPKLYLNSSGFPLEKAGVAGLVSNTMTFKGNIEQRAGNVSGLANQIVFNENADVQVFRIEGRSDPYAFFVDSSNLVGLGISTPTARMDILDNGPMWTQSLWKKGLRLRGSSAIMFSPVSGTKHIGMGSKDSNFFIFDTVTDSGDGDISHNMFNIINRDVGIGTETPQARIHEVTNDITGSLAEDNLMLEDTRTNKAANIILKDAVNVWDIGGDSSLNGFYICKKQTAPTNLQTEGYKDYIFITPTGRIGSGTKTPDEDIQLEKNKNSDTYMKTMNINAGTASRAGASYFNADDSTSKLEIGVASTGYTNVVSWVDSGYIHTGSTISGGLKIISETGGVKFSTTGMEKFDLRINGANTSLLDDNNQNPSAVIADGFIGINVNYSTGSINQRNAGYAQTLLDVRNTAPGTLINSDNAVIIAQFKTDLKSSSPVGIRIKSAVPDYNWPRASAFIDFDNYNKDNSTGSTDYTLARIQASQGLSTSGQQGGLIFNTNSGSGIVARMYITNQGRVGISSQNVASGNNSLPDYELDVKGDIGIDQYIYHNDDVDTYMRFNDQNDNELTLSVGGIQALWLAKKSATVSTISVGNLINTTDTLTKSPNINIDLNSMMYLDSVSHKVYIGNEISGISNNGAISPKTPTAELDIAYNTPVTEYIRTTGADMLAQLKIKGARTAITNDISAIVFENVSAENAKISTKMEDIISSKSNLIFATNNGTTDTESLRINSTQDVSVGFGALIKKNFITNGTFETDTSGWVSYNDGAASYLPVDGIGGTATLTFARSTTSPISGTASCVITKPASNCVGQGLSYPITIDSGITGRLFLSFNYQGTFADLDVGIYAYDVTNSVLINTSTKNLPAGGNSYITSFPVTASTSYRLIFHVQTTSILAWTLKFDSVVISTSGRLVVNGGLNVGDSVDPGDNNLNVVGMTTSNSLSVSYDSTLNDMIISNTKQTDGQHLKINVAPVPKYSAIRYYGITGSTNGSNDASIHYLDKTFTTALPYVAGQLEFDSYTGATFHSAITSGNFAIMLGDTTQQLNLTNTCLTINKGSIFNNSKDAATTSNFIIRGTGTTGFGDYLFYTSASTNQVGISGSGSTNAFANGYQLTINNNLYTEGNIKLNTGTIGIGNDPSASWALLATGSIRTTNNLEIGKNTTFNTDLGNYNFVVYSSSYKTPAQPALTVNGTNNFVGIATNTAMNTSVLNVSGKTYVSGDTYIGGNLGVGNDSNSSWRILATGSTRTTVNLEVGQAATFNTDGGAYNFQIKSDGNDYAFFVAGVSNQIGMFTSTLQSGYAYTLNGNSYIGGNKKITGTLTVDSSSTLTGNVGMSGTLTVNGATTLKSGLTLTGSQTTTQAATFNTDKGSNDFIVKSAGNDYAFFVDASANQVGMFTSTLQTGYATTLLGNSYIGGSQKITGTLTVDTTSAFTGNVLMSGTLGVSGLTTLGASLALTGSQTTTQAATFNTAKGINNNVVIRGTGATGFGDYLFYTDAATNRVGISGSGSAATLATGYQLTVNNNLYTEGNIKLNAGTIGIGNDPSASWALLATGSIRTTNNLEIGKAATFNTDGGKYNFTVFSDSLDVGSTPAFYVDGTGNFVSIGTNLSTSGSIFNVTGKSYISGNTYIGGNLGVGNDSNASWRILATGSVRASVNLEIGQAATFNTDKGSNDFIVKSAGNDYAFFVDASANQVGMFTSTLQTGYATTLAGNSYIGGSQKITGSIVVDTNATISGTLGVTQAATLSAGLSLTGSQTTTQAATFNTDKGSNNFIVRAAGDDYAFYVNGANNQVSIGTGTQQSGYLISVGGNSYIGGNQKITGSLTIDTNETITGVLALSANIHTIADSGTTAGVFAGIQGTIGSNDFWFIGGSQGGSNDGYMEISTGDDGTEPIYVRQYTGAPHSATTTSGVVVRTLTLLDGSGNTSIPGILSTIGNLNVGSYFAVTASNGNTSLNSLTTAGDIKVSKNNPWLTLSSPSTGASETNEQAAGISIGESGYKGAAALHLTYTGDGYGHIGMGTVTNSVPAYEAIKLFYTNNNVEIKGNLTVTGGSIAGNASSATMISSIRTNWKTNGVITGVTGLLSWKNYGNNHVIFDASEGTSPDGTAISNTNPDITWGGTYPTLMGWNGINSYGVRVDSARYADTSAKVQGVNFHADTTAPTGATRLNMDGNFFATKVYNAVYNDLAEFMWKSPESKAIAGDVMVQTEDGVKESSKRADVAVVGVFSDSFGIALYQADEDKKHPIGMSGTVAVKTKGNIAIGDELVSYKNGYAIRANFFEKIFKRNAIIGKVLKNKKDNNERVLVLIK